MHKKFLTTLLATCMLTSPVLAQATCNPITEYDLTVIEYSNELGIECLKASTITSQDCRQYSVALTILNDNIRSKGALFPERCSENIAYTLWVRHLDLVQKIAKAITNKFNLRV